MAAGIMAGPAAGIATGASNTRLYWEYTIGTGLYTTGAGLYTGAWPYTDEDPYTIGSS